MYGPWSHDPGHMTNAETTLHITLPRGARWTSAAADLALLAAHLRIQQRMLNQRCSSPSKKVNLQAACNQRCAVGSANSALFQRALIQRWNQRSKGSAALPFVLGWQMSSKWTFESSHLQNWQLLLWCDIASIGCRDLLSFIIDGIDHFLLLFGLWWACVYNLSFECSPSSMIHKQTLSLAGSQI